MTANVLPNPVGVLIQKPSSREECQVASNESQDPDSLLELDVDRSSFSNIEVLT